jgi:hypothetical protein
MNRFFPTIALCLAICSQIGAQGTLRLDGGTYRLYGHGCANLQYSISPALLWVSGSTRVGTSLFVHWQGPRFVERFYVYPRFMMGLSDRSFAGAPLPMNIWIHTIGGPDCWLWTSVDTSWSLSPRGTSTGSMELPIPNDPNLVGLRLFQQWTLSYIVVGTYVFTFHLFSNGGALQIGA